MKRDLGMVAFSALVVTLCVLAGRPGQQAAGQKAEKAKEEAKAPAPPDDSKLYVWGQPEKGTQTLILIRAIDGERVEAAYLVPVVIHLGYGKGAKQATAEQIDAAGGGRLLPFDLRGRDRFGRLVGDAWLGKETGWLTEAAPKQKAKEEKK